MNAFEKRIDARINTRARSSENLFVRGIDIKDLLKIPVGDPDDVFKVFGHLPKPLFTFPQRLLSPNAVQGFATMIGQSFKMGERTLIISIRGVTLNGKKSDDV